MLQINHEENAFSKMWTMDNMAGNRRQYFISVLHFLICFTFFLLSY